MACRRRPDDYNRSRAARPARLMLTRAARFIDPGTVPSQGDRRGRKWGLSIVLAAHNWRAKDVSRGLSAMYPTRVCFRVADDTSGMVALNSRRWGKQAMNISTQHTGRGILLLDGRYQVIQAYHLTTEQERQVLAIPVVLSPLSEIERSLVAHAIEQLDGRFIVNKLAAAFAGQGVTHHQVQKMAAQFERRGWLTPAHATDARRLVWNWRLAGDRIQAYRTSRRIHGRFAPYGSNFQER